MICSILHSLNTTIMLVQYRWDTVRAFETSSYILQRAAKLAGLAPALLWSRSKEKSNSRNESYVCWYSECYITCWSIADTGLRVKARVFAQVWIYVLPRFVYMDAFVSRVYTSLFWRLAHLIFEAANPSNAIQAHCQQSTAVRSKSKWIKQVWLEGKQCCFALVWAFPLVLWRTQFSRALYFQTVCFYWRLLADLTIKMYLNALLNRGLRSRA